MACISSKGKASVFWDQMGLRTGNMNFFYFSCVIVHEFRVLCVLDSFLAIFFCGRLWQPIKWCVFVPRDKCRYFHVHKFFLVIFVFNSPRMFIDMWSQLVFGQQFSWTFVTTILIKWVGPDGQTDTFSSSNDPQSGKIELIDFASYSPWIFFMIRDSDLFFIEISCGYLTTLLIAWVGRKGQTSAFSTSIEAQSGND